MHSREGSRALSGMLWACLCLPRLGRLMRAQCQGKESEETQPMSESKSIASQIGRASAIIIVWSLVDKVLAIGKEMLTAHRFGVSASLDVFNVAYSFPGIVVLLCSSALVSAFVPLYLEWSNRSSTEEANAHALGLVYLSAIFFAALAGLCIFLSPVIFGLIGYGFNAREKELGDLMERSLSLLIFIDGVGILLRGLLHARKKFFHLYVAPIFVNITIIVLLFYDRSVNIYVLVWGFLIGTSFKTLYMGVALYREGIRFGSSARYDRHKMKTLCLLALPLLGSELIANSNLLVDQVMATQLPAGSVSTLRYAFRINDFPIQVVITAISRAIFPFISEEATAGNLEKLREIFKYAVVFLGFLTIPITCLMVLFSEDLVTLLLKRGAFDLAATKQTAETLVLYSLGLFFYAYTFVNGTFFSALQNTKPLLYMGIASIFLNGMFNVLFMHFIGVKGIALSTSVTMATISIWFICLLKKHLGVVSISSILRSFSRLILAAACMLGLGFLVLDLFKATSMARWVYVPITAGVISCAYLGVIWRFRTEELYSCLNGLAGMLKILKR